LPPAPKPIDGTYTVGDTSNPKNIAPTVDPSSIPQGSKVLYCDSLGNNCSTTAPALPNKPGTYVYCIKSIDTVSNLTSTPCKYDTITILPTLKPGIGTYTSGNTTNPKDISGLHSNVTPGSKVLYCDSLGNNCTYTAPLLPTTPGQYIYCIKAVDTATGLTSTPCKYDTVIILPAVPVLNSQTYCQGTLVNAINVNATAGATLNWYTAASGGIALTYVPTANTSIVGVTTYHISQTINGIEGSRSPFTITVLPKPTTPAVITGKSATTVGSTEVYSVVPQSGYTYTWNTPSIWTINSGQGTNSINTTIQAFPKDTSGNILVSPTLNGCAGDPAILLVIVNQVIPAIPAAPSPTNGKYTAGDSTNPKNISPTVNPASVPSGSKILYCDSLGNNCSTVPPTLPTRPGVYIYCIKSIDTISNMMSTPCKYDTITILPPAPKPINGTYTSGNLGNPSTIAPTVINVPQGSKVLYCDSLGNNCSFTAPALPTTPGRYIYCVKSVDTASGLMSDPCKYDTINIISAAPNIDLRKTVSPVTTNAAGDYVITFKIKVTNRMSVAIDSLVVQDDLDKVFGRNSGYIVSSNIVSGNLVRNDLYNGSGVIDLITPASTLAAGKSDSVLLTVVVKPSPTSNTYSNVALLSAKSPFGNITDVRSDDPTVNPTDTGGVTKDLTIFTLPAAEVVIPGGFSPNKDGVDDVFFITAPIDSKIGLQIINRWGNSVFKSENYDNTWDGKGQSGSFLGEYVPMGTYYYIVTITYGTGEVKKFTGSLLIVR
jgi:gliding motility-associated-like protein